MRWKVWSQAWVWGDSRHTVYVCVFWLYGRNIDKPEVRPQAINHLVRIHSKRNKMSGKWEIDAQYRLISMLVLKLTPTVTVSVFRETYKDVSWLMINWQRPETPC